MKPIFLTIVLLGQLAYAADDEEIRQCMNECIVNLNLNKETKPEALYQGHFNYEEMEASLKVCRQQCEQTLNKEIQPEENQDGQDRSKQTSTRLEHDNIQSMLDECKQVETKAHQCCNNPVQCLGAQANKSDLQLIASLIVTGSAITADPTPEIAQVCRAAKNLNFSAFALNSSMGAACSSTRNSCVNTCQNFRSQIAQELNQCEMGNCDKRSLEVALNRFDKQIDRCQSYGLNASQMFNQASQSAIAIKLAEKCKKGAETASTGFDTFDPNASNINCSDPANVTNPLCQGQCNRPGAENDPLCRINSSTDSISSVSNYVGGGEAKNPSTPNIANDANDGDMQFTSFKSQTPIARKANEIKQNGGGFNPSPSGPFGVGGPFSNINHGGGYDVNIEKGLSGGGNSYLSSDSGGGFSGYGQQEVERPKSMLEKFGNYLTGLFKGKNDQRSPSSIVESPNNTRAPIIGAKDENIFNMISLAYLRQCERGEMDCSGMDLKHRREVLERERMNHKVEYQLERLNILFSKRGN